MLKFKNPRVLEILKTRMEFTDKLSLNNRLWFMVIVYKREDRMKRFAASLARVKDLCYEPVPKTMPQLSVGNVNDNRIP